METVHDLDGLRRAARGRVGVELGAIPRDHLNLGMLGQPGDRRLGAALGQQGDHVVSPQIDEDGAEAAAFAPGPLIQPKQLYIPDGRQGHGADQGQKGVGARAHTQDLGEPCPRLAAEGEPDLLHGRA